MEENRKNVIQDIKAGKYKDCYLVYNRKSTDEPNKQQYSIYNQQKGISTYIATHAISVAHVSLPLFCTNGIISEKHTAFKEDDNISFSKDGEVQYRIGRPKFQRLIQFLSQGYFRGVICLCYDRLSRNDTDSAIIEKLIRRGIDVRFVWNTYEDSSSGMIHRGMDATFSRYHSLHTSEKVTDSIRNAKNDRKCTYKAPVGYLNKGTMEHKPFDPKRHEIVRRLFELYSTGEWSLSALAQWANQQGFTMPPMRTPRTTEEILADEEDADNKHPKIERPLALNALQRILDNKFYAGYTRGIGDTWVLSRSHKPLIYLTKSKASENGKM